VRHTAFRAFGSAAGAILYHFRCLSSGNFYWILDNAGIHPHHSQTLGDHSFFLPKKPYRTGQRESPGPWPWWSQVELSILPGFQVEPLNPLSFSFNTPLIKMSTSTSIVAILYQARWYIASALFASYLAQSFRVYRRLAHVKGPWLAQFSDAWLLGAIYRQRAHHEFYAVNKKYGR
jgi:hypothetical protein